jgi:hypothetical protein
VIRLSRWLIPATVLSGLFLALGSVSPTPVLAASNPVVAENQQPGSAAWQLGSTVADDSTGQIKGYASATSVSQNDGITLYVSVNPVQTYTIDFYRIGWYGGLGGRLLLHAGPLSGMTQQPCLPDQTTGLIACAWPPSYTVTIPTSWTSGVYLALLTNALGYQNYVTFVVKDGRPAAFLYQQSVTTYEAYNNYPNNNLTGKSLYTFNSYGAATISKDARAVKVSFDRPYTGNGAGLFFNWEINFVRWMERSGYDVTYSTDIDTHANGAELLSHKAFLSVGHDEYWSKEMFDAAQSARDAGVSLGFFGSNAVYWQIRFESSAAGSPNRVIVCYKDASIDPMQGPTTTVNFRSAPVNRPEQTLMGIQFTSFVNWGHNVGYAVTNSNHWAYIGSGFTDGDVVPGIVGYEMDRYMPDYPLPSFTNRTLLSQSPFTNNTGVADYANSSIYQAPSPSNAWVFAAGTMAWSWALDSYNQDRDYTDSRIQQTTTNILNTFLTGVPPSPPALQITAGPAANAGPGSAVITWQTNNPADSRVDYGLTGTYGSAATTATRVTSHSVALTGLASTTTYHYKVTSVDAYGQTASSADGTFTTTAGGWSWVQGASAGDAAIAGGAYQIAIPAPQSGDFLALSAVVADTNLTGTPSILSVTDNGTPPSTWTRAVTKTDAALYEGVEIWYTTNVRGQPTLITITINPGGSVLPHQTSVVEEYSGIATTSPVDQTAANSNYNVTACPTGTTSATSVNQELAIAIYGDNNQGVTVTAPAGWTVRRNSPSPTRGAAEVVVDQAVPIGTQSATFTTSFATWALTAIATFQPGP